MNTVLLWLCGLAYGGAWTRDLGSAYVKGGVDVYQALRFVAPGEGEESQGSYFGQQYGLYGEMGVSPGHPVQITVAAPLTIGEHNTAVFDALGELPVRAVTVRAGDARIAVQTALSRKLPIAAAVEAKIPLYENGGVGESLRNLQDLFPKPGDGQLDVTGWLYAGAGLNPKGTIFVEGGLGHMFRTEEFVGWETDITFNDSFRFIGKGGIVAGPVIAVASVEGQLAYSRTNANGDEDLFTREFVVASIGALIDIAPGLAIEPRFAGEVFARNASQGIGGGIGISYRR